MQGKVVERSTCRAYLLIFDHSNTPATQLGELFLGSLSCSRIYRHVAVRDQTNTLHITGAILEPSMSEPQFQRETKEFLPLPMYIIIPTSCH